MKFEFSLLLSSSTNIRFPVGWVGWVVWLILATLIILAALHWKNYNRTRGRIQRLFFLVLLLLTPVASLFFGFKLTQSFGQAPPALLEGETEHWIMIFSGLPWILAGGLLGPVPAALIGLVSGIFGAFWGNHSAYLPLETALIAILYSAAVNQRYRTYFFRLLRRPVFAALGLALVYPILYLISAPFTVPGAPVIRLDYAINNLAPAWISASVVLILSGLAGELLSQFFPTLWGTKGRLLPSPAERSLQARFLYSIAPIAILLVVTLLAGSWIVSESVAKDMLENQMATTAQTVANQLPFFMETGQTIITQMGTEAQLYTTPSERLPALLENTIKTGTFFSQLVVLDEQGDTVSAYPNYQHTGSQALIEELAGIQFALTGMPTQSYTASPAEGGSTARVSFITPVKDENNAVRRVLLGRVDLARNPFTQAIINSLNGMEEIQATGMLIDENQLILVHPNPSMLLAPYSGRLDHLEPFFTETGPDGTRRLVYVQPVEGLNWRVVLTVPTEFAQQLSLRIAAPLLGMIMILSLLALLVLNLGLRMVTNSLESLGSEADEIAKGRLDQPLQAQGEDEVGQLRQSFEKMRISLKGRLDELNQLLSVSQSVAANLEMEDSIRPVLESALSKGASVARVILSPSVVPELEGYSSEPVIYSVGPAQKLYNDLDEQIVSLTRQKERLILTNLHRPHLLNLAPGQSAPASLIAFGLRHENQVYGAMWIAYDQPHAFPEDEVRFLATLASQAAVAAANAHLFLNAEVGRQRLAAILASSPDPILVTDQKSHLLLANPAAWQLFDLNLETEMGQPVENFIHQKELLKLLQEPSTGKRSAEIAISDSQVYLAAVSGIEVEGRRVGQVCVLRDVTRFKELDALKSEFVSTVSHDLRTPLALMRGYATMLEMVGQLNEQQSGYARKIVASVESMSRLVNNLLDQGRIESGISLQLEVVSARDIIERVTSSFQIQANQKKIQLKAELPANSSSVLIEADPALLQQALSNLVENAIKYTRNEGKVILRLQPQSERVIFEVSDNGIGISPMDQPRLFERFYRGPQASQPESLGSGLGLSIVQSIAERHAGQVWVESQLGLGSTFYLAIPYHPPKA